MDLAQQAQMPDQGWTQRYEVVKELGDCYASVGDLENAKQCYEKAAWLEPDEAGPYVGTGVIELQQGRADDAEIAFRVAIRLDGQCSKAHAGLAMIAQQREDWSGAFDSYLKSLELDNDNLTALLGLFQVSCQMGSFGKVIHYLQVYLKTHPGDTAVMFCLAALYLKENRLSPARGILTDILTLEPGHTDAQNLLEELEHKAAQSIEE